MYQYTEVFMSLFVKFSRKKQKITFVIFMYVKKKNRKTWNIEKLREKNVEIMKLWGKA